MKAIGIDSIESFPFPTPPPVSAVRAAISLLVNLGALSFAGDPLNYHKGNADFSGKLTALGEAISEFPLNPRYSKMIILASRSPPQLRLLPYVLTMVSALAEGNMLFQDHRIVNQTTDLEENEDDDSQEEEDDDGKAGILRYHPQSDCLARLRAVGAFLYCQLNSLGNDPKTINGNTRMHIAPQSADLCQVQALSIPVLSKVLQLRHQLQQLSLSAQHGKVDFERVSTATIDAARIPPPSMEQETALRQIILSGYCDSIAKRVSITTFKGYFESIGIDMKTLSRRKRLTAYATCNPSIKEPIFIHPSSSLYRSDPTAALPEYICYNSLLRSHRGDTLYMSCCTVVSSNWLPELASDCPLLRWSAPLSSPLPEYDAHKDHVVCYAIPKYGAHSWELAPVKRIMLECYSSCETTIEETTALKHASTSLGQSKLTQEILALKKLSSAVQPLTTSPLGYRKVDEPYR